MSAQQCDPRQKHERTPECNSADPQGKDSAHNSVKDHGLVQSKRLQLCNTEVQRNHRKGKYACFTD